MLLINAQAFTLEWGYRMSKARFISAQFAIKKVYWSLIIILFVMMAWTFQCNLQLLINKLDSLGIFTSFGFLLLYCLVSILCLPTILLVLAGGVLFGPLTGTVMNLCGATLGAACGFCITRYLRSETLIWEKNSRVQRLVMRVEEHGWRSVALLRLTPFIPFNLVNYSLGLTRIKFIPYISATMFFLIPSKIIVTCSGYYGINVLDPTKLMHLLSKMFIT